MTGLTLTLLMQAGALTPAQIPAGPGAPPPPDMVLRWNDAALAAIRAEHTPPPMSRELAALLHNAREESDSPAAQPRAVASHPLT